MARALLIILFSLNLYADTFPVDYPEDFSWAGVVQHIDQHMIVISDKSFALSKVVNVVLLNHKQSNLKNISTDMLLGVSSDHNSQIISLWQLSKNSMPAHFSSDN